MPDGLSRIVIATANPHKVAELRALLAAPGLDFVGLADLGGRFEEPAENGTTFEANAAIKARSYAEQTGLPCLADDSGLEVDALGGAPGVVSSHYCTDGRDTGMIRAERDAGNNLRLLRELEGVPPERRAARFVCCMVLARPAPPLGRSVAGVPDGPTPRRPRAGPAILLTARGSFEGRIGVPGEVPRGANGFGYDPLFLVAPSFTQTSAELAPAEKNRLSHRARAAAEMLVFLRGSLHAD